MRVKDMKKRRLTVIFQDVKFLSNDIADLDILFSNGVQDRNF